jgi:hypothetical protein
MSIHSVQPGDPLRPEARDWNAFVAAGSAEQMRLRSAPSPAVDQRVLTPGLLRVRNDTSSTFDRFDAVRVTTPAITPYTSEPSYLAQVLLGSRSCAAGISDVGRLAICLEPIGAGKIGRAIIDGLVQCKINVIEEWHEYADFDPTQSSRRLVSNPDGSSAARILWKESGTGSGKWATLQLGNPGQFHLVGKVLSSYGGAGISARAGNLPGSGTIQVYYLDPNAIELAPLLDPSGQPCYLDVYSLSTSTVAADEWVLAHCDRWGTWWIESVRQSPAGVQCWIASNAVFSADHYYIPWDEQYATGCADRGVRLTAATKWLIVRPGLWRVCAQGIWRPGNADNVQISLFRNRVSIGQVYACSPAESALNSACVASRVQAAVDDAIEVSIRRNGSRYGGSDPQLFSATVDLEWIE